MPDLTVGVLFPLTGPASLIGRRCTEAALAARKMVQVDGWSVRMVTGDASSPAAAASETRRLIEVEGAAVIVGTLHSDLCLAASEMTARLGGTYWEAIASANEITQRDHRNLFRLGGNASQYARTAVDFVAHTLVPVWGTTEKVTVATLVEDAAFPRSFGEAAAEWADRRSLSVVAERVARAEEAEVANAMASIRDSGARVLFSAGFDEFVPIAWRQVQRQLPRLRAIIGIAAWGSSDGSGSGGYEGVFATTAPYLWDMRRDGLAPEMRALLEQWWALSSTAPSPHVGVDRDLVFSATYVLLRHVLPTARDATADAISRAARTLDLPMGNTPVGAGVRFDADGNNERALATVMQWQQRRRVIVAPKGYASGRPIVSTTV